MSIKITFPDGAVKEFNEGITALEIAGQLSNSLPKKVLAAEINGEVQDATRAINADATLKLLTWNDTNGKSTFWHSSAHLFAEAMEALYKGVKFGIGPPIENGFYYDIDTGDVSITLADLPKIEKKMAELANLKSEYKRQDISKAELLNILKKKAMNINWNYWKDWKTDKSRFTIKAISRICVAVRIFQTPVTSKPSN
jgi:threonyl-tRNA synthetase